MFTKKSLYIYGISLSLALYAFNASAQVDGIPAGKRSPLKAEETLCGVTLYKNIKADMPKIIERLGKPTKTETISDYEGKEYTFKKNQIDIVIDVWPEDPSKSTGIANAPYRIKVSGTDLDGFCKTVSGVKLGDTIADVKKTYQRYMERKDPELASPEIRIGWKNSENILVIERNKKGNIESISLEYPTE